MRLHAPNLAALLALAPLACGSASGDTTSLSSTSSASSGGGSTSAGSGGAVAGSTSSSTGSSSSSASSSSSSASSSGSKSSSSSGGGANASMNFFVTSDTSTTGNLGGLAGADQRCQKLAAAVGQGSKTWRAYLSASSPLTNARDRIGEGPYYNSQGMMLAANKTALHMRSGDPTLFITEQGGKVNGQWAGSPSPVEHDILTGATVDGMLATNLTCGDWTSTTGSSQVGHTDGLGPNMNPAAPYSYWNAAHTGQCANTAPGGGAGRLYCFVGP